MGTMSPGVTTTTSPTSTSPSSTWNSTPSRRTQAVCACSVNVEINWRCVLPSTRSTTFASRLPSDAANAASANLPDASMPAVISNPMRLALT